MPAAPWLLLLGFMTMLVLCFSLKSPGNTGTRISYSYFRQEVDERQRQKRKGLWRNP